MALLGGVHGAVRSALDKGKIKFKENVAVGGALTDFVVEAPNGRLLVLEAKNWSPTAGNVARAKKNASFYEEELGCDKALYVLRGLKGSREDEGIIDQREVATIVERVLEKMTDLPARKKPSGTKSRKKGNNVFAAMPFEKDFDDVYRISVAYAAKRADAAADRLDDPDVTGNILDEMDTRIRRSIAVIADITRSKPNVMYEVGYAHALGKPLVIITQDAKKIPFNLKPYRALEYVRGQTYEFRKPLARQLKAALAG